MQVFVPIIENGEELCIWVCFEILFFFPTQSEVQLSEWVQWYIILKLFQSWFEWYLKKNQYQEKPV